MIDDLRQHNELHSCFNTTTIHSARICAIFPTCATTSAMGASYRPFKRRGGERKPRQLFKPSICAAHHIAMRTFVIQTAGTYS